MKQLVAHLYHAHENAHDAFIRFALERATVTSNCKRPNFSPSVFKATNELYRRLHPFVPCFVHCNKAIQYP